MPTYEYACAKCGQHFDLFQSFTDEPLKKHAGCGGKLNKVLGRWHYDSNQVWSMPIMG